MARSILREVWDGERAFVSVTQAFNTASSMDPLALNVLLLSFTMFEREVTAVTTRHLLHS